MCARKAKIGIDYFPMDVDFFEDKKIVNLLLCHGSEAVVVFIDLLCRVYEEGYYIKWDSFMPKVIAKHISSNEEYVCEVVDSCIKLGLFSEKMFKENGVLTSKSIQNRYQLRTKRWKDSEIKEYNLVDEQNEEPVSPSEERINVTSCDINVTSCDINVTSCRTEEKRKRCIKRKEDSVQGIGDKDISLDKVKDEERESEREKPITLFDGQASIEPVEMSMPKMTKTNLEERRQAFYDSLIPYLGKYSKECLRAFFDCWAEVSDGGYKMRWEKVRDAKGGTWSLAGRLATFERNGYYKNKGRTDPSKFEKGISLSTAIFGSQNLSQAQGPEEQTGVGLMSLLGNGSEVHSDA